MAPFRQSLLISEPVVSPKMRNYIFKNRITCCDGRQSEPIVPLVIVPQPGVRRRRACIVQSVHDSVGVGFRCRGGRPRSHFRGIPIRLSLLVGVFFAPRQRLLAGTNRQSGEHFLTGVHALIRIQMVAREMHSSSPVVGFANNLKFLFIPTH